MKKLWMSPAAFVLLLGVCLFGAVPQSDSGYLEKGTIRIRIFEGSAGAGTQPAKTVTSSFSQNNLTEKGEWDEDPEVQAAGIRKAFNLASVVFTSANRVTWDKGITRPSNTILRFPNKADLSLEITPTDVVTRKIKIEVFEQNDGTRSNVLSTEVGLPKESYTIFGFKDLRGNPYFISLQLGEWNVRPMPPAGSAVRAVGQVQPPKLIKKVEPVYPQVARKARVEGIVVLEAQTDEFGRVQAVKVLRSIPILDQAAIDAVRQWEYEPMIVEGKPRGIVFTVTVRFDLKDKPAAPAVPAEGPVRATGQIKPPALIKQVEPDYPLIARDARVEGIVILEAMTDIYGRVASVKVLRSIPLLDQAAIDAVRQWEYEPMMINGKAREIFFTVTVRFTLDKKPSSTATTMQIIPAEGGGTIRILNAVAPHYPDEARKANVDGTVLLEAPVSAEGLVGDVRVLRPVHPALDKAAIDAFKEWKFESRPLPVVGGKPDKKTVIVAARFQLNPPKGQSEAQFEFPSASWKAVPSKDSTGGVVGGVMGGVIGGVEGGVVGGIEGGVEGGVTGGVVGGVIKADLSDKAFQEGAALLPVRALGPIRPPELVKRIEPIYPLTAIEARVDGTVILEITTDVYGRVQSVKILRSIPLLDQAAIDAVRQWLYKPLLIDGKPRGCVFTTTVRFVLQ